MSFQDIGTIGFLVVLEGLLSFDNALALAVLVRHLPENQQRKALTYGIFGAFGFRFLALSIVTYLLQAVWLKFVGGVYLLYVAVKMLVVEEAEEEGVLRPAMSLWRTIVLVEFTDIAFSSDSILASVAVSSKFYVVLTGGILGIIAMRFVSTLFIKLIKRFPGLETSGAFLVLIVGVKMLAEGVGLDVAPEAWVFMGLTLLYGFFNPAEKIELVTAGNFENAMHVEVKDTEGFKNDVVTTVSSEKPSDTKVSVKEV